MPKKSFRNLGCASLKPNRQSYRKKFSFFLSHALAFENLASEEQETFFGTQVSTWAKLFQV